MILCAAIKTMDGVVHEVPRPGRHGDVIAKIADLGYPWPIKGEQGFITDKGLFLSRHEAAKDAFAAGQTKDLKRDLFSEDLW